MAIPRRAAWHLHELIFRNDETRISGGRFRPRWRRAAGRRSPGPAARPGLSQQAWTRPFRLSWRLGIDMALPDQAAESGLDMRARAAETVVEVEVAEGGVEVVAPQQADHAAAEPDAFRVAGRPVEQARRLGDLVDASSGRPWRCRRPLSAVRAAWDRRSGRTPRWPLRTARPPRRTRQRTHATWSLSALSRRF